MDIIKNKHKMMDIFTFIIGLSLYIENTKLTHYAQFDILGPKYFPMIITISIMILSVISFFTKRKENKTNEISYNYLKIIQFLFFTIIYLLALTYDLGFFICSTMYLLIIILLFENYKLNNFFRYLVFSLAISYSIYYFFVKIMQYPLP
jgi:hypothetical protein